MPIYYDMHTMNYLVLWIMNFSIVILPFTKPISFVKIPINEELW
jgi:hypothetical protein